MGQYDLYLGSMFIGVSANTYLFGIVTVQFIRYYSTVFHDPLWIKSGVLFLLLLDSAHSAIFLSLVWDLCVQDYDNPPALNADVFRWQYALTPTGTTLAALVVQGFQAHRILCLTGSWTLFCLIVLLSAATCATGLALTFGPVSNHLEFLAPSLKLLTISWLVLQIVTDTTVTVLLTWCLARLRGGLPTTDTIVNRFIRGAVQTGLFSTILALVALAFALSSRSMIFGVFTIPLGRVYTNTLMDSLLMRTDLQKMAHRPGGAPSTARLDTWWTPVVSVELNALSSLASSNALSSMASSSGGNFQSMSIGKKRIGGPAEEIELVAV